MTPSISFFMPSVTSLSENSWLRLDNNFTDPASSSITFDLEILGDTLTEIMKDYEKNT